jgi:hypothetical protein
MLRANYNPTKTASLFIQLREECKARNEQTDVPVYRLAAGRKRNLTVSCDYGSRGNIRMKSRLQCSDYLFDGKNSRGFTLVQDVSFSVGPFRFTGRHALFDTDDLDNRQYVYEADAWLAFSFPAYSGAGVRNYLLIEYKAAKNLTLWARFAATHMQHGDEIGSGGDLIAGNTRNDVKFQARLSF